MKTKQERIAQGYTSKFRLMPLTEMVDLFNRHQNDNKVEQQFHEINGSCYVTFNTIYDNDDKRISWLVDCDGKRQLGLVSQYTLIQWLIESHDDVIKYLKDQDIKVEETTELQKIMNDIEINALKDTL